MVANYLETPTGEAAELTDEQKRQNYCGEARQGEWITDEDGSREFRTYGDGNSTGCKTDDTTGLLARTKESELMEVKESAAGPSVVPMVPSQ